MRPILALIAFATLTACGVDGTPEPPARSGITITGEARMGVQTEL